MRAVVQVFRLLAGEIIVLCVVVTFAHALAWISWELAVAWLESSKS